MYILDTDTLSRLHRGNVQLARRKDRFDPAEVVTSMISRIEILLGRFDFVMKAADAVELLRALAWLHRSELLLTQIIVIPFPEAAAAVFDGLRQNKKLKKIGRA